MEARERIKQKADELFRKYGFRSITMDQIASQLGISKKTIYQFFDDKDKLVHELIENDVKCMQTECSAHAKNASNAIEEIFMAMEFNGEMFRNMNPMLVYELEKFHPSAFTKFREHKEQFLLKLIMSNIRRGIKEELYREELHPEIIARLHLETAFLAFNPDVFPLRQYNLWEVQQQMMDHYLFGLATEKGYKLILKYKQQREKKLIKYETVSKAK